MLRNLDWLHQLDVDYDLSTFDTDPFEPEPEGFHTIFPFWVPRPPSLNSQPLVAPEPGEGGSTNNQSRSGYVELPYTLPQDSTLFLFLRERSIDLWKTKVDWIAAHGGMILLDTHPDYMAMAGSRMGGTNTQPNYTMISWNTFVPSIRVNIGMSFPGRWRAGSPCMDAASRLIVSMDRPIVGLCRDSGQRFG